jgi:MFS family permease
LTSLLLISGTSFVVSVTLFAILPDNPNYWQYIFPAMICATLGIDITYNVSNIFITTSMPKARQGLAGAFINSILFVGISFFLGFADLAVTQTAGRGKKESYKVAFQMSIALSGAGLLIMFAGVNIGKAKSELTVDEKEDLERELGRRNTADAGGGTQ